MGKDNSARCGGPAIFPTEVRRAIADGLRRAIQDDDERAQRGGGPKIGFLSLRGFAVWIIWLLVHVIWLIGFRNKVVVLLAWAWDYFLYDWSVRVITDAEEIGGPPP